ncbi:ABC transporter ATP-binding protein [Paracoccus jeotgali]|uniref:ABC transporter ATP-binding protein n=1 Tax=Paracoccus jeotgali TaxID=2065379 RepID=A0A2K9MJP3_9RHOB|nr:ABC transporter ATP-binding protein [Paracoccus jeotgali]AUM75869.1 ABC transporter ATP-binding protein [Paracoccus jeotgali]
MLETGNLHAYYGKSHILHGVDITVGAGEIVSLVGRNGVGRSTTVKTIMGQVSATGSIRFKGEEILGLKPFMIACKGVGYVPESRDVFPTLSVEKNLLLGVKSRKKSRWGLDDIFRMFPRMQERRNVPAGVLSGGEQQMLTLGRTLMGDPDLILIDEPTEGLAPMVVAQVGEYLQEMKAQNISVLLVEQKLDIALKISQRIYVMGHGAIAFAGTPAELHDNQDVRKEWLEV